MKFEVHYLVQNSLHRINTLAVQYLYEMKEKL